MKSLFYFLFNSWLSGLSSVAHQKLVNRQVLSHYVACLVYLCEFIEFHLLYMLVHKLRTFSSILLDYRLIIDYEKIYINSCLQDNISCRILPLIISYYMLQFIYSHSRCKSFPYKVNIRAFNAWSVHMLHKHLSWDDKL